MNTDTSAPQDRSSPGDARDGGTRNRFFRGKVMRAFEFELEQRYEVARRRLLTRAVAGWGLVHGMALEGPGVPGAHEHAPAGETKVLRGLAIDRHGREAVIVSPATVERGNTFLRGGEGHPVRPTDALPPGAYLLSVHYAERRLGDARLPDDCRCEHPEKNFVRETVVFSLTPLDEGGCPCGEEACRRACGCAGDRCGEPAGRGSHACLCQWSRDAEVRGEPELLCEWRGAWLDPEDGVALACVRAEATPQACTSALSIRVLDACSPRRLLKTNDELYDLLRGCDLTRIASLSWGRWHRRAEPMPWHDFATLLDADDQKGQGDHATRLEVRFTGPVRASTLTPDCFALRFIVAGADTGWSELRVAPVTRVLTAAPASGDPAGTTRSARLCVDSDWYDEVTSGPSVFKRDGATVRIEVYGDYILDCRGQAVDANARGFALQGDDPGPGAVAPSGNGTPGGTLISVFRVQSRATPHGKPTARLQDTPHAP